MTAPGTPNLGPIAGGGGGLSQTSRSGSLSGSPWQLVEVSNAQAAAAQRSHPSSPNVLPQPLPPAALLEEEEDMGMPAAASGWADWLDDEEVEQQNYQDYPPEYHRDDGSKRWPSRPSRKRSDDDEGFDPAYFVGDWMDNLGHRIQVVPGNPNRGGFARRRRSWSSSPMSFLATLSKLGAPDKKFNISRDRGKYHWTCGNGQLVYEESGTEVLVWRAGDGRMSTWTRAPPEGAVYFDAPPDGVPVPFYGHEDPQTMGPVYFGGPLEDGQHVQPQGPPVYFDPPPEDVAAAAHGAAMGHFYVVMQPAMDWKVDDTGEEAGVADASCAGAVDASVPPALGGVAEEGSNEDECPATSAEPSLAPMWNTAAPEFVPASAPHAPTLQQRSRAPSTMSTPSPSPKLGAVPAPAHRWTPSPQMSALVSPATSHTSHRPSWGRTPSPSPMMGPLPPPHIDRQAGLLPPAVTVTRAGAAPVVEMGEEHPDVRTEENMLEWSLPESWGRLSRYPKDFCLTSPMFGMPQCPNMQLAFYPNGSRTAEDGQCTVALTRGPESAGIKFEFRVNGRSIGPKVCLGRRYLGDYPKPFDDSEESKLLRVNVRMEVLEILGMPDG